MPACTRILSALVVLATGLIVSACSHAQDRKMAASGCCGAIERYPRWLVMASEPIAPVVGTAISYVNPRRGHLTRHPEAQTILRENLRPLDIVVMSSKGRLSGTLIPGLFGHVAVYLGTEAQLRQLGIWNSPDVKPHHEAIRAGKILIESDKKGIHLSSPARVFNTDLVLVLRVSDRGRAANRQTALHYFGHLGGRFDFHFDSGDDRAFYCAELVDHVVPEARFPKHTIYGRKTILPDAVAEAAALHRSGLKPFLYLRADAVSWQKASTQVLLEDLDRQWQN